MDILTSAIELDFRRAGWTPERRVAVGSDVPVTHPAHLVLRSFGGLRVGEVGAGEECAKSDVEFHETDYNDELINAWQSLLKSTFIGIGECHNGHGQLWLDDLGRLFQSSIAGCDMVVFEGPTFGSGMERLLRGRRSEPMLLPWESEVTVWGAVFRAGDAGVRSAASFNVR